MSLTFNSFSAGTVFIRQIYFRSTPRVINYIAGALGVRIQNMQGAHGENNSNMLALVLTTYKESLVYIYRSGDVREFLICANYARRTKYREKYYYNNATIIEMSHFFHEKSPNREI